MASLIQEAAAARARAESLRTDLLGARLRTIRQRDQTRQQLASCTDAYQHSYDLLSRLRREHWGDLDWQDPTDQLDNVLIPIDPN